jgi:hypothetical protein
MRSPLRFRLMSSVRADSYRPSNLFGSNSECRGSSYDVGKQMAEGFLKTARGSTFHRRKGHHPFGFILKDAQAALCTYAPNIWEELLGLADGLKIALERAAAEYSNSRLRFPNRGCSSVMTKALYGRNYDYSPRRYDRILGGRSTGPSIPRSGFPRRRLSPDSQTVRLANDRSDVRVESVMRSKADID